MPKDETIHPDRALHIAAAAARFVAVMNDTDPSPAPLRQRRHAQQKAYDALVAALYEQEAIDATDS